MATGGILGLFMSKKGLVGHDQMFIIFVTITAPEDNSELEVCLSCSAAASLAQWGSFQSCD